MWHLSFILGKLNCEDFFQSGLNCSAGGRGQEPCPPIADTTFYCSTTELQLTTFLLLLLLTTLLQDPADYFVPAAAINYFLIAIIRHKRSPAASTDIFDICCILFSEDHTYSAPPVVSKAVADRARQRGGCLI